MRSSILSRSLVAVAAIAVGSAALVSTPATAASATGITREQVLAATAGARSEDPTDDQLEIMKAIVRSACDTDTDGPVFIGRTPVNPGQPADGVVLTADRPGGTFCTVFALTTATPGSTLAGTATISGTTYGPGIPTGIPGVETPTFVPYTSTETVSGDVFVTTRNANFFELDLAASGDAVTITPSTTTTEVRTPKTTAQKKAAKMVYDRKLAQAKKTYKKAVAKAGKSSKKKAKARKAYRAAKTAAKARYRTAVAPDSKLVSSPSTITTRNPFSVTATTPRG